MKDSNIENLLTTDYIYIKYYDGMEILVHDNDLVFKNDLIMKNNNRFIYSTVSGKVLGLTNINNSRYIVIENDYRGKTKKKIGTKKYINNYTREELKDLIIKYNVLNKFDETSKVLIINGIDEFNTEITFNTLFKEYTINILDAIDALIDIMNIKKCVLAVSNSDIDLVNILFNNMGTYPKIELKLFTNDNIIGKKEILLPKLTNHKNKKYNVEYLNILDVLNIYNLLKKNIPVSSTYITLTGDLINYTKVLRVNIGTNLSDILKEYNIDNKNIIINGLLNGISLKDTNFIIDKNIRSIYVNKLNKYKTVDCINCGLCVNICPVNINPKYMYFNKDKKSKQYKERCINCGMCSYVCPSKIELNKGCVKYDKE